MGLIKYLASSLVLFGALLSGIRMVSADEGMWIYNNLPKQQLKTKYGFDVTDQWANHLMKSSVRFNSGGSGSFISSRGLVLTNHHVGADAIYKLSTPQNDYLKDGFLAKTEAEELKTPDLELNQLVDITDVTETVNMAVKPEMTAIQAAAARKAAIAKIEKESTEKTGLRSDVVTLYQGGQFHLYRYKKYTDVRLVFAPESDIAFFGGDPDNFEFPRYDLDMAIFRVYEDGKPATIENFLKWSDKGAVENELVFVSGHPGRTSRMYTVAALEFLRDVRVPYVLDYLRNQEVVLQQYSIKGAEQARRAKDELFGIQNSRKVYIGRIQGLQDSKLMQAKQKAEYDLRSQVELKPELQELAGAWDTIAKAQAAHKKIYVRRSVLEAGQGFNTTLFSIARTLVRMAEEDTKPNEERLAEYRDSGRASLLQTLYSDAPIYDDLEAVKLADGLSLLMAKLGKSNKLVQNVLQGKDPVTRAQELIATTTLAKPEIRKLIAKGGVKAIAESYDPMIQLAVMVDKASRAVRKQYEDNVEEVEKVAYAQIAKALFAIQGTSVYPDATFTLRLAFGEVKGWKEGASTVAPFTTLGGAFEHEKAHGAVAPWKLPAKWHAKKDQMDLSIPFNFVSTNDIIGGNSGSPVVNREGELVGLIFDGNIHSLIADYVYTDEKNRAVSVHSSAMKETMLKVYEAEALVNELGK